MFSGVRSSWNMMAKGAVRVADGCCCWRGQTLTGTRERDREREPIRGPTVFLRWTPNWGQQSGQQRPPPSFTWGKNIYNKKRAERERETELRYRFIHVALAIAFSPQDIKERDEANEVGYRERNRREQEEKLERKRGKWYEEKTSRSPLFVLPTIFCCCCFCLQQSRTLRAWRSRTKDLYSIQ